MNTTAPRISPSTREIAGQPAADGTAAELHGERDRPCSHACYQTLAWPRGAGGMAGTPGGGALRQRLPQLPQPSHRLLALCHEVGLRRLVALHMARLRNTPLFAQAGPCFDCVAQRVADFVVESCGGPLYYSQRHSRLQAGHGLPLLLDAPGRELWLVQLWHAMDEAALTPALQADYWNWAEPLSVHLLAPQARHAGLSRYPYDTVRSWFLSASGQRA
ncbi:MAG: hypothetical protein EKK45_24280 [Curvibacter sp.]|nr:MAG: hypothetical protein EKK45_24280 [Curvibacter sp.]